MPANLPVTRRTYGAKSAVEQKRAEERVRTRAASLSAATAATAVVRYASLERAWSADAVVDGVRCQPSRA